MKTRLLLLLAMLLSGTPSAHAWTIELTEDELQARLDRVIPVEKKKLLFRVLVSAIDVELTEGSDRIGLLADMEIRSPYFTTGKGKAYLDGKLSYNPGDGAFYFQETEVREVKFENIPDKYHEAVRMIFHRAISRRLAKTPVYTLQEDKTRHQIAKVLLKSVTVIDRKLVLELGLF